MFPMISGIEEIRTAKRIFFEVKDELLAEGEPLGKDIEIGVMIEVPSAVIIAGGTGQRSGFLQYRNQ